MARNWPTWSKRIKATIEGFKKASPDMLREIPADFWPDLMKLYLLENPDESLIIRDNEILTPDAVPPPAKVEVPTPRATAAPESSPALSAEEQAFYNYIVRNGGEYLRSEAAAALGKSTNEIISMEEALRAKEMIE